MSLELHVAIENARDGIESVLPAYAAGTLRLPDLSQGLGILFRQVGTCQMLLTGVAAPFFVAQMQAASVYLSQLPTLSDNDKVTSMAGGWWSPVAGGYWDAAEQIARMSRTSPNLEREHEDDFLYVMFLMKRYCLRPATEGIASTIFDDEQSERLARWRVVLEGNPDPRLELCEALQSKDAASFQDALVRIGKGRRALLEKREASGTLKAELALWMKPVWLEGLALLRLAERDGLGRDFACPDVPPLIQIDPPFRYDAQSWRVLDIKALPSI